MSHSTVGARPDTASAYDSALNRALAQKGNAPAQVFAFPTSLGSAVTPGNITGPLSAFYIAAFMLTPRASGNIQFNFGLLFTDSAADTVTANVLSINPVTAFSGGTLIGTSFRYANSGTALTITGTLTGGPASWSASLPAGGLTQTIRLSNVAQGTIGVPMVIALALTGTHNLSGMSLDAAAYELP